MLQPFRAYLQGRWQAGCTNVAQLKRELDAQGYRGSYSLVVQALSQWRDPRPPPDRTSRRRRGRPRMKRVNLRWLCLCQPQQLQPHECDALQDILNDDERLAAGYELLQRFCRLINRRSVRDLIQWQTEAAESGLRVRGMARRVWLPVAIYPQVPSWSRIGQQTKLPVVAMAVAIPAPASELKQYRAAHITYEPIRAVAREYPQQCLQLIEQSTGRTHTKLRTCWLRQELDHSLVGSACESGRGPVCQDGSGCALRRSIEPAVFERSTLTRSRSASSRWK